MCYIIIGKLRHISVVVTQLLKKLLLCPLKLKDRKDQLFDQRSLKVVYSVIVCTHIVTKAGSSYHIWVS